jgi:hypothetical protein
MCAATRASERADVDAKSDRGVLEGDWGRRKAPTEELDGVMACFTRTTGTNMVNQD